MITSAVFIFANLFSPALVQGSGYYAGYACQEAQQKIPFGYEAMGDPDIRCAYDSILEGDICHNADYVICSIALRSIRWEKPFRH